MYSKLVKSFCTPPFREITNFDVKSIANSEKIEINFKGSRLAFYSWGKGKIVLLLHGWGSRASHFVIMAQIFKQAGFRVVAFDAPAHSSINSKPLKATSNIFEFGRALYTVAKELGGKHAIVAHSLGAATAAFTVSGFLKMEKYKILCQKLVLISSPSGLDSIIHHFSVKHNLSPNEKIKLKDELEKEFDFIAQDYIVGTALQNNPIDLMLVHDKNDDEIPISQLYKIQHVCRGAML
jgi:pimeloyl-ACP methyl ester carboxylesterase